MAERHSRAERQRVKNMLSDAIRVLCQNTVKYDVELCVEALIGITVDGGKDVLIVSLNELIGKQAADTTFGEEQCYDAADESHYTDVQADFMEDETGEYLDDTQEADQEYDDSGELCMPYGTVVKQELMSTITYNSVGQKNHFQPIAASSATHYKTEPYVDDTAEQYYDEQMNPQNVGLQHGWSSQARLPATVSSKSQTSSFGAQKQSKSATPGGKRFGRLGGKVSRGGGGQQKPAAVGTAQSLSGGDAVAQITLYTCGICGAQMQHYGSFLRHKKSHTVGHSYRCDGCGKIIRRHDNLITHQRRCLPYLSQLQHNEAAL